jgi:hypothetical protein
MSSPFTRVTEPVVLLLLLLQGCPASADVVLKPSGQDAYPLRTKALKADTLIDGQFAATRLTFTFQNETPNRIEADFMYTLPANTVVTHFAYWFGEEKVVARIVEKERAAAIYRYITSRMRDPALVEMVGKDTFRARIFPVMPNADLKVEMVLMQILPSDGRNIVYSFPIRGKSGKVYDALDFRIDWRRGSGIERFGSNYGTNLTLDSEFARFRLSGSNFHPAKDLRMTAVRYEKPLHMELYSAPSGGGDGFFALALTPDRTLSRPIVQFSGVQAYTELPERHSKKLCFLGQAVGAKSPGRVTGMKIHSVLPARLPNVKAGRALFLFGRYTGSGPARVTLSGITNGRPIRNTQILTFGNKPIQNHIASKLWAWRRIEQLSEKASNRKAVIVLSKRYALPSKFTSWLAVPKAEMERYKRERIQAEIEVTAQELAQEIVAGRERSALARRLRVRLEQLCKQVSEDPKYALQRQMSGEMDHLAQLLAPYILAGREKSAAAQRLRARMNWLAKETAIDPKEALQRQMYDEVHRIAEKLGHQILAGRGESDVGRRLRTRLNWLGHRVGVDPKLALQEQMAEEVSSVAQNLADEIEEGRNQGGTAQRLRTRLKAYCHYIKMTPQDVLRHYLRTNPPYELASHLAFEIEQGQAESEKARELRAKLEAACERLGFDPIQELRYHLRVTLNQMASNLMKAERGNIVYLDYRIGADGTYEYVPEQDTPHGKPDPEKAAKLRPELERMARAAGQTARDYIRPLELLRAEYEARQVRAKLLAERRKKNPDPNTVRELETQFTAINRQVRGEPYARERLRQMSLKNDRGKLDAMLNESKVYLVAAKQRYAEMIEQPGMLRVRRGDPLLQIDAPEDAAQIVALMPDGEVKRFTFNTKTGKWEIRFDIPTYLPVGTYAVTILIVHRDGTRQTLTMRYYIDGTPPEGKGRAAVVTGAQPTLRLEMDASADTARITALLPWGDPVRLQSSTQTANRFFALVPLPSEFEGKAVSVTFVLTDKAHNRTTVTVNMEDDRE